ncbi:hypothetical protein [Nitrososphaera viennensis]|uniref:Uncharacterized protein n=2 Tax=Nitrososphaera viennensis TaxID=1034015 RepID=A0A060HPB9_9ARCH|nr:hypothetical protein [Nitrososphaera viennensis]AIC15057.1 hypothetical protein NVIE_008390 [Nitrososphaera viennensis EN76]UVS69986.1 hypothetical protein NWT39_04165 [Nitrososphaera viennensis]
MTGSEDNNLSDDHRAAMAGWKARKEQLHRQQESVYKANDEAEKVNLISLSKKKEGVG